MIQQQALNFLRQQKYQKSISDYEQLIEVNPDETFNYWYLGLNYLLMGNEEVAESIWFSVLLEVEEVEKYTQELIQVLKVEGDYHFNYNYIFLAQKIYEYIEKIEPENLESYQNLAYIYQQTNHLQEAEIIFKRIVENNPHNFKIYLDFANLLFSQYRVEETINILKKGIQKFPNEANLYFNLMEVLKSYGKAKEAIIIAEQGLTISSNYLPFLIENMRILPIIYANEEEINYYRQRFSHSLDYIIQNLTLESEDNKKSALTAISLNTNFYLQYQGKNDLILQKKYANLITKIINTNYPKLSEYSPKISKEKAQIKIGFVSSHFRDHNGANWALGWIKHLDRKNFTISCYYLESIEDQLTLEFKKYSDYFYSLNSDLELVCDQIIQDKIDILIYTDIGMKPLISKMASLRLAPIQCTTLGHPITSGFATIDYYISRSLMELSNAQQHYSEKLVLLPNIGICIPKPKLPLQIKSRNEFNLPENAVIYLCCQSLFKYLPQYDYIFPRIAQQVPQAKFVFIEFPISNFVNEQFQQRLTKVFTKYNLNYQDYCLILPRLNEEDFSQINLLSDVFLDTLTWNADNTTIMAIACNLPVVTCPGEFMRSLHSYGHLKMIEVEDTIAFSEEEYISIAVKLGNNPLWRKNIIAKIAANQHKLFNDLECVRGLERLFKKMLNN